MHYVADVKAEDPVVGSEVLQSKGRPRCDLEFLLLLKFVHLLEGME